MPSVWLRNGPTRRNCSAPTLLLSRRTPSSRGAKALPLKSRSASGALPANRHSTGGQACRPSTGTPGRSPPAWGKLRTRNDGAAAALYPLSAPGGGEGWGEVGDSRTLADTHLTLPSLRDGPLPLRPEGRRGISVLLRSCKCGECGAIRLALLAFEGEPRMTRAAAIAAAEAYFDEGVFAADL